MAPNPNFEAIAPTNPGHTWQGYAVEGSFFLLVYVNDFICLDLGMDVTWVLVGNNQDTSGTKHTIWRQLPPLTLAIPDKAMQWRVKNVHLV